MNLPEAQPDKPGPSISGQWTEVSPNTLCMTQHIGTLTVAEGREWEISVSLNGMVVFVETDLSYSADVRPHHGGATDNRRFMMNALPLIKELAACLLSPPEATPAPQPNVDVADLVERAFEIGFCWRSQLMLQNIEDSRAVGRTLQSYLFDGIDIETRDYPSFETGDHGIVEAKKRIIKALRALASLSPQPREVGE